MSALFWGIVYLIILAFLITLFFNFLLRVRGPWGNFWAFFIIILLAIFAADVWISPVGPYWGNTYWVPPLATGLIIALLLAATTPSPKSRKNLETSKETTGEKSATTALDIFFWFLIIFLVGIIVAGYIYSG
jgi:hypothetical protein